MKKVHIILFSILGVLLIITGVLFGAVFRLRSIDVTIADGANLSINEQEIIELTEFGDKAPIFTIDKDKAIKNIESQYPKIKVIQIKTTSVMSVEIRVRERIEMFYAKYNDSSYYILDEELKVLRLDSVEPSNLIDISGDYLAINDNTKQCDFLSTEEVRNVTYNLFVSFITTVDYNGQPVLSREKVCEMVQKVTFTTGYTKHEQYTKLVLTLRDSVKVEIAKPESNLQEKINICFSAYEDLTQDKKVEGTIIKYYLTEDGDEKVGVKF